MTIAFTLDNARDQVDEWLDNDRDESTDDELVGWTETQIDKALQLAIDKCLLDYKGEQFRTALDTTTDSNGQVDLSAYDPLRVVGASITLGSVTETLPRVGRRDRTLAANEAISVEIEMQQRYTLPTTDGHPLIGSGATAAPSFPTFNHWVCAVAAQHLAVSDNEKLERLDGIEASLRATLKEHTVRGPRALPKRPRWGGRWYRWQWEPSSQVFVLKRTAAFGR